MLRGQSHQLRSSALPQRLREHCKHGYAKKLRHVKRHEHGRTVKVTETHCVKTAAKPTTPSASPTTTPTSTGPTTTTSPAETPKETPKEAPKGPFATTTVLHVSEPPEDCEIESIGGTGSNNHCRYRLSATVSGNGATLASPVIELVFTNPAEPGKEWVVEGTGVLPIQVNHEKVGATEATSVFVPGEFLISSVSGNNHFSVYARYHATATYSGSQSAETELTP
jgi:hypothetical protein